MNPKLLHILQHSLGCDDYGRTSYRGGNEGDGCFEFSRNRFVTDPGNGDGLLCVELVNLGLMKDHGAQSIAGGMHCYIVTREGVAAMKQHSPKPPKVSRSRSRYLQFLHADLGCTFAEYLKNQWYKPAPERHDPRSEL